MERLIVGGGPVGLFLGSKVNDAILIDQKPYFGRPTQCTGIVTEKIREFLTQKEIKKVTQNITTDTEFIGPTKTLRATSPPNIIMCNQSFEELLADKAAKQGTELLAKQRYIKSDELGHHIKDINTGKERIIRAKELLGADGPLSNVNKQNAVDKPLKQYGGMQVRVRVKSDGKTIKFYPHIGNYAWFVPESENIARIGVCTNKKELFDAFLKKFGGKVIENQSGIIPIHQPRYKTTKKEKNHTTKLFGDAAGQIKNTTGGGIVLGLQAATNYAEGKSNKGLNKELYTHFLVHNFLKAFSDKDWDYLIKKMDVSVLADNHRDHLRKLIPTLATDPAIGWLATKHFLTGKVGLW